MNSSPPSGTGGTGSPPIHKRMPVRRPASTSSLFTITQTSTNCFQRRPPRGQGQHVAALPAPSLQPPPPLNEESEGDSDASHADDDIHRVPVQAEHEDMTSAFGSCRSATSMEDDSDSEYSDHDLWNSAMQSYLLDSDDDEGDDTSEQCALSYSTGSLGDQITTSPFLVANVSNFARQVRREAPLRKRSARKEARTTTSSARMTPSHSSQTLDSQETTMAALRAKNAGRPSRRKNVTHRYLLGPLQGEWLSGGQPLGPLTIVFDIDETLVSARDDEINVRPYVKDLLDLCAALHCEVIVWTAGMAEYVNPILRKISVVCGRADWYHHVISRHRRWYSEDKDCCKDLSLLNRPLERVLLIENNPVSVMKQFSQAILVEDYIGPNDADETLKHVASVVRRLVATMTSAQTPVSTPPLAPLGSHPIPAPRKPVDSILCREAALVPAQFLLYEVLQHSIDHTGPPPEQFEKMTCYTLRYSTANCGGRHTYGGITPLT